MKNKGSMKFLPKIKISAPLTVFALPFLVFAAFFSDFLLEHLLRRSAGDDGKESDKHKLLPKITKRVMDKAINKIMAGSCGVCSCICCFRRGTLVGVSERDGTILSKPIEQITVGDTVLAVDFRSGGPKVVARRVISRSAHEAGARYAVEAITESGATLMSTENHPVVINTSNETLRAGSLRVGQMLLVASSAPRWERVQDIRFREETADVYSIELEDEPHNFLVSSDGAKFVLVHNK